MKKEKIAILLDIAAFVLAVCGMLIAALAGDLPYAGFFFGLAVLSWALAIYNGKIYRKRLAEE